MWCAFETFPTVQNRPSSFCETLLGVDGRLTDNAGKMASAIVGEWYFTRDRIERIGSPPVGRTGKGPQEAGGLKITAPGKGFAVAGESKPRTLRKL